MGANIEWIENTNILSCNFDDQPTIRDLNAVMLEFLKSAQAGTVYFLLDFTDVQVPSGLLSLPLLLQVINHANTRWLGIVKEESPASYMTQLLSRDKVKTFRDRRSTIAFLEGMARLESGNKRQALA